MKHDDYDNPAYITIAKHEQGDSDYFYTIEYRNSGEEWSLYGTKEEVLTELSEHMDNIKVQKKGEQL